MIVRCDMNGTVPQYIIEPCVLVYLWSIIILPRSHTSIRARRSRPVNSVVGPSLWKYLLAEIRSVPLVVDWIAISRTLKTRLFPSD